MFLAHISEDGLREQSILDHLQGTAALAADFAEVFGCREWGYNCGLLHDIGKYTAGFHRRLRGGPIVDHASAGARELYNRNNQIGAYCIAGHHSGLPDGGCQSVDEAGNSTLSSRMKKELNDYQAFKTEIEIPAFPNLPLKAVGKGGFTLSFCIRMIFSCLVDADFLDTEAFMSDGKIKQGGHDTMQTLLKRLRVRVEGWLANTDLTCVNGRRSAILKACMEKGRGKQGLYLLTVPTGGGKTVSSLAFALEQAAAHNLKRIIYVIPYTSIIDQNAKVFQDILGEENVLEDHCSVVYDNREDQDPAGKVLAERKRRSAENWDCPVVVTTNVQFFESLFANRTSKCRKLHNIAGSVVIFDEAQMLPAKYLKPCVQAISELIINYRCTAVLCTATQPALDPFFPSGLAAEELCPDPEDQFRFFKRTSVINQGQISQEELISQLQGKEQVLCILNSRKRVQKIYGELAEEGTYQLSTLMYPKDRKHLLAEIKQRLTDKLPCRVIATSLVEAGVDMDFPAVFRELAGIDSVVQAAGRCNREGNHSWTECETTVFTFDNAEDYPIAPELKQPISVAEQVSEDFDDVASLEAIADYFRRLYRYKGEGLDAKRIIEQFESGGRSRMFPFETVARKFKLIENSTKAILIDLEEEAQQIVAQIRFGGYSRDLLRRAGQYTVNVYENDFKRLYGAGLLEELDENYYLIRDKSLYTFKKGLVINVERGDALLY